MQKLLPSIRAALAKILIKKHSEKEVAKILGVTPSAVSQYLKGKRGKSIDKKIEEILKEMDNLENFEEVCCKICKKLF